MVLLLPLVGCLPTERIPEGFIRAPTEKEITLQQEVDRLQDRLKVLDAEKARAQQEANRHQEQRISIGSAQVHAAHGTLEADDTPNKYSTAAHEALGVAKEALPMPSAEDLLRALEEQKKLLSEQAREIAQARDMLQQERNTILHLKSIEKDLNNHITNLQSQRQKLIEDSNKAQTILKQQIKEERQKFDAELANLAAQAREENQWYNRLNPFRDFKRGIAKISGWLGVFLFLGVILKMGSIFFPQAEIIRWLGRVIVWPFKLFISWIPDALRAFQAVPYQQYVTERDVSNRSIGAIQEWKNQHPDTYKDTLRPYLVKWNKDKPELEHTIENKLKELNLKKE